MMEEDTITLCSKLFTHTAEQSCLLNSELLVHMKFVHVATNILISIFHVAMKGRFELLFGT